MTTRTAVVVMAYGTPRHRNEILEYYTDIRRGRPPTDEQLADLTARYDALGGTSPLAARTDAQAAAIAAALDKLAPEQYEVMLGLKHAAPRIETTVNAVADAGFTQAVGLVLAPHFSTRSIGEYHGRAATVAAERGIEFRGIEHWYSEPSYITFLARTVGQKLATMPVNTRVLFTAHSIPQRAVAEGDPYAGQLADSAMRVAAAAGLRDDQWQTAWQSAGRTPEPWLGPDILTVIDNLAGAVDGVLVCPCGFVADHLEVLYDLDIEGDARARKNGLAFARTDSMNDDPAVIAALAHRIVALAS
jgi:protoporphyrin/coproporphyrin ferrochelatase